MGCPMSKLDKEEIVQLCKDRKRFIKQAIEQRNRFASYHIAYMNSLKRVSNALREYVEGDEPREFLLDSFKPPFPIPLKKNCPGVISINYLKPSGNPSVIVEEAPPKTPENVRVEAYLPCHQYGTDGFFAMQFSPMNYSLNYRPSYPPPSPQYSQWDLFWNPFSSLDYYGYTNNNSLEQGVFDNDVTGLRQVREQEGIPELEEETEHEKFDKKVKISKEKANINKPNVSTNHDRDEVIMEDDDDDYDEDDECDHVDCMDSDSENGENGHDRDMLKAHKGHSVQITKAESVSNQESAIENLGYNKETPGFMVYVNRRPTSMVEVIEDLEAQFTIICSAGNVVSALLEARKAQYYSSSNDLSALKMLNPLVLFSSGSSRSSSSRFLIHTPTSKDEIYESSWDFSDETRMLSGSHQITLDRLYAWEKKLYHEVRNEERVRMSYEKKCSQLRDKVVKGEDPFSINKTRASIRDLYTQIKVSIHSIEAISKRIETLRDEELQPQLLELAQGLGKMWKSMAESHQSQKLTLNEAKILLSRTPSKQSKTTDNTYIPLSDPHRLARSASNLEDELLNWQSCFKSWIASQRLYVHTLTCWLLRGIPYGTDTSKLPFCPTIYGVCIEWSRLLDAVQEDSVIHGLDFFAAGMGSIYTGYSREDNKRNDEIFEEDIMMSFEKLGEIGIKVLCAGMSVVVSSLTEFATGSAEGYADLSDQSESTKCKRDMTETRV